MIVAVLAWTLFIGLGLVLAYILIGDTLGFVDLDRVFNTRRAVFFTLFPLGMLEVLLWDWLIG